MSYKALTDVIVNPTKIQDLQLSNPAKTSLEQTSSVNFADYLAKFNNKDSTETAEPSANENSYSKQDTISQSSNTQESNPENNVQNDEVVNESKSTENKSESKKLEKDEKNQTLDNKEVKLSKNDKEKITLSDKNLNQDKDKVSDKKLSSDKKERKLSNKDFAKLNQLTEEENKLDENQISKLAANLNQIKSDKKDVEVDFSDNNEENLTAGQIENVNQNLVNVSREMDSSENNLDFNQNNSKEKKTFTLDKDGKITVEDLRTQNPDEKVLEKKSELKITEIKQPSQNTATITMDLNQNANADVLSLNNQTAASNASNFQQMLNNQIVNSAPEFVKAGNLVLKDNNQGTINLLLHPNDLGNVKIHLSLDGKSVSAQITVATKEALQVFKDNAETLREAFIKSGFEAGNFDVAFNNGNGGSFNQSMDFSNQNDGRNLMAQKVYSNKAEALDSELENIIQNAQDISNYSVNIVA